MYVYPCSNKNQYLSLLQSSIFASRYSLEQHLCAIHKNETSFTIPGICTVCEKPVDFLVDHQYGLRIENDLPIPNWRERQVCPSCQLNSRQRIAFGFLRDAVKRAQGRSEFTVYMMEQVTPIYARAKTAFAEIELIGSEYLGPETISGTIIDGIRHEDVHRLSMKAESVDLVVSNDVMEHVPDPRRGFGEIHRVLRVGGALFLTIPFFVATEKSVVRAELRDGKLIHHLPEVYHGNPMSEKGSLVFTDFGWDVLRLLNEAGFQHANVVAVWSFLYGCLGIPTQYFHAVKGRSETGASRPIMNRVSATCGKLFKRLARLRAV